MLGVTGNRVKIPSGPATVTGEFSFEDATRHTGKVKESDDPEARRPTLLCTHETLEDRELCRIDLDNGKEILTPYCHVSCTQNLLYR
ncbi:hypothetical protein DNHGIG_29240 [Collibacillus ludicampi]|uniref:Uncharacterized protein n=1 Tax=Collibacillus ludicampi TaxID=2771369 RepID=A0AAV4LHP7_9BACL|nr:hypothetical protein DNHGIG_29240 [Collibacillus ludicampi]